MSLKIGDNFNYQGKQPNFARDQFSTLEEMKNYPITSLDEGHMSTCLEDGDKYVFSLSNSEDSTTGYWRKLIKIDTELDGSSENPVQNKVIVAKFSDLSLELTEKINQDIGTLTDSLATTNSAITRVENDYTNAIQSLSNELGGQIDTLAAQHRDDIYNVINVTIPTNIQNLANNLLGEINNLSDLTDTKLENLETRLSEKDEIAIRSIAELKRSLDEVEETTAAALNEVGIILHDSAGNTISDSLEDHVNNQSNPHNVTKSQVGLGNVSNNAQVRRDEMGVAGGVATLAADGKLTSTQVRKEVVTYTNRSFFPEVGESNVLYLNMTNMVLYSYLMGEYVPIRPELGITSTTAFSGASGKVLSDNFNEHVQNTHNPHQVTPEDIGFSEDFEKIITISIDNLKEIIENTNETVSASLNQILGTVKNLKIMVMGPEDGDNWFIDESIDERLSKLERDSANLYYLS